MVDRGGGLPLALEALAEAVVGGELGREQLQRDWAAERELRRAYTMPMPPRPATDSMR